LIGYENYVAKPKKPSQWGKAFLSSRQHNAEGNIMLTISIGVPDLDAYVAACRLRSWDLSRMFTSLPAVITISLALE
jgi:uncharacterized short protein YbdD (DUF466 family)